MEVLLVLFLLGTPVLAVAGFVLAALKPEIRDRVTSGLSAATRSLPGRLALLAVTGCALLVPLQMVEELRQERGWRLVEVQDELARQWGGPQTVIGPMLWVPVLDYSEERVEKTDKDGNVKVHYRPVVIQREFLVLPQALEATGDLEPRSLHRGLYDVLVYDASVALHATFERPELTARPGHTLEVLWHEAQMVVELSDLSAVSAVDALTWQSAALKPESGALPGNLSPSGIRGVLPGFDGEVAEVEIALELRGMGSLFVGALGEDSAIEIGGAWHSPSFAGFTLPKDRKVSSDRFAGTWSVPGVARPMPQVVEIDPNVGISPLRGHTVGVTLLEPASPYVSVERAITYGILVITLCLLTFLVLEHGLDLKLHPVQWLVNGLALVVFYLVLLATSEHRGFELAYGIASATTVVLIAGYTLLATRALRAALTVIGSLSVLYGAMFAMLRSEDHALLTGTALVVAALACTMWVTRHLGRTEPTPRTPFVDPPGAAAPEAQPA